MIRKKFFLGFLLEAALFHGLVWKNTHIHFNWGWKGAMTSCGWGSCCLRQVGSILLRCNFFCFVFVLLPTPVSSLPLVFLTSSCLVSSVGPIFIIFRWAALACTLFHLLQFFSNVSLATFPCLLLVLCLLHAFVPWLHFFLQVQWGWQHFLNHHHHLQVNPYALLPSCFIP